MVSPEFAHALLILQAPVPAGYRMVWLIDGQATGTLNGHAATQVTEVVMLDAITGADIPLTTIPSPPNNVPSSPERPSGDSTGPTR
jgi:hypothetical protein